MFRGTAVVVGDGGVVVGRWLLVYVVFNCFVLNVVTN